MEKLSAIASFDRAQRLLPPLAGALIVLALGAGISLFASQLVARYIENEIAARFEARNAQIATHLERRLDDLRNLILGLQGLFIASSHVSREEFRQYSQTLDLKQRLGGLQAISFQRRVLHKDKAAFTAQVRNDRSLDPQGLPEFAIRPEGDRAEYLVIDYIEPMAANRAAFGFDAGTQPGNADAIRLARDSGRMQVSEPFTIVQSPDGPPRIVVRAPVYQRGMAAHSVPERRAALKGFVVLTVETRTSFDTYFNKLLEDGERLVIEDAGLYEGSAIGQHPLIAEVGNGAAHAALDKRTELEFGGRKWQVRHGADAGWTQRQPGHGHAHTVLAGGAVISLLLAALYYALAGARKRAWQLVDDRTRELRRSDERFRTATTVSSEWYWEQDRDYRFISFIGQGQEQSGVPRDKYLGKTRWEADPTLLGDADWDAHRADLENRRPFTLAYAVRAIDGSTRWLESKGQPRFDERGEFSGYHGTARDITRQVDNETLLRTQADLLQTIFDHINQGISVVDARLDMVGCNRRFIELLGFPEHLSRPGTPFEDFVRFNAARGEYGPGDTEALVRERVELARRFLPHRFKRARPDGTVIEVLGTPLPGGGMVTTYSDVTEQERTQQALVRSERFHRSLIEISPDAIFAHRDGVIQFANPAAASLFGAARPEDLSGLAIEQLVAPEDRPQVQERIASLMAGKVSQAVLSEKQFLTLDGRRVTVESSGALIDLDGRPAVLTVARDITERERAASRILQERDFRQHIIESIPGVFYLIDADGRFLLWNRNFERVTGYSAEAIAAASALDFFEGADRQLIAERIGAVFSAGSAKAEARFRMADGTLRPYFFTGDRLNLEDGRPGLVGVGFDISERKLAEEALARQSGILQATLEAMDQGISVVDAELHMTALNQRFCELLEFPQELALGGADFADFARFNAERGEYGPCDIEAKVREMVEHARHPESHHFRRTRPNGRIIEVRGKPLPGGGFVTTYTDVTEQEHAQAALRFSEQRYRNLIELSPDAIFVHRQHVVLLANPAAARLWGLENAEQAIGRNVLDFIHPASRDLVVQRIARLDSDPALFRLPFAEQDYLRADGSTIPVEGSATRIEMEDGPAILSVIRDISTRKEAENTIRRERDFRQRLIESVPGIFFLFDPRGHFLLWNKNLEQVLGMSAEEIGRSHTLALYDEADRNTIREASRRALASGASTAEATLVTRRGERIPYFISGLRIEVDGKQAVIGLGLDISERKLAEQVIRDLNDTLEQRVRERTAALEASNRELESFSYSVSHDLRAPLRALHGFSHLLGEEYAHLLDENGLHYLQRIQAASERMGHLIDDLIELARIGRQELKRSAVDLSRKAADIAAFLAEQAPERRAEWRIAPGIRVDADPVLMRVALENLLGNAWKFTAKAPMAVIEFGAAVIDGAPACYVRDNGAGFDATYADKLFKPFQRLHRPDEFAGTGIGLATVARIIERHGGRIWAEGAPGQGATFWFALP